MEIDVGIEKWADLSHAIKNFGSRLDEAKTTHPELFTLSSQKKMSPGDIARFLMNTARHFLVIMSPMVTSAKLLSSVILESTGSRVSQGENLYRPGAYNNFWANFSASTKMLLHYACSVVYIPV